MLTMTARFRNLLTALLLVGSLAARGQGTGSNYTKAQVDARITASTSAVSGSIISAVSSATAAQASMNATLTSRLSSVSTITTSNVSSIALLTSLVTAKLDIATYSTYTAVQAAVDAAQNTLIAGKLATTTYNTFVTSQSAVDAGQNTAISSLTGIVGGHTTSISTLSGLIGSNSTGVSSLSTTITNLSFFVTLEQFGGVADGNPATGTGTINDAAMDAALAAVHANKGGTIQGKTGTYRFTKDFDQPTSTTANAQGIKPSYPIRITGMGHHSAGEGALPKGGTIFMWTAGSGRPGRFVAKGEGTFSFDNFTWYSHEGNTAGSGRPFLYSTNATILGTNWAAWTDKQGAQCDDDFWVAGGTTTTLGDGDNAPFQGYKSLVTHGYLNGIRRGLYGRTYFNANNFSYNNFWTRCGSNLTTGVRAAIELDADPTAAYSGAQYAVSNVIANNLVEIGAAYDYGIRLSNASQTQVIANDSYDTQAQFVATVRLESTALATMIQDGFGDNKTYVSDGTPNQNYTRLAMVDGQQSIFKGIKAGTTALGNTFNGQTTVSTTGAKQLIIKPSVAMGTNRIFSLDRSSAESLGANGITMDFSNGGEIRIDPDNLGLPAVGITTGGASNASFSAGFKTWAANGSGGTFTINTGTGGSYMDIKAYATRLYSHTSSLMATVGNLYGGNGYSGIAFGTAADVGIYRASSTQLRTDASFVSKPYTAAANPTTSDIASGYGMWWKNTVSGKTQYWMNDGGTMKSSPALDAANN